MLYRITYTRGTKEITVHRNAEPAESAGNAYADQHHWGTKTVMIDADTRGKEWAEIDVDTDGGINYNMRLHIEKI